MDKFTDARYIVEVDAEEGWVVSEAFFYLVDAQRWRSFICLMVDDSNGARIVTPDGTVVV